MKKNVQKLMVKKKYESEHYILIFLDVIKKGKSKKKKEKWLSRNLYLMEKVKSE